MAFFTDPPPIKEALIQSGTNYLITKPWIRWFLKLLQSFSYANNFFFGYDSAGEIAITSGWTDLTLDTEVKKDGLFTHADDSAEVTVNKSGEYEIIGNAGFQTAGNNMFIEMRLTKNGTEIDGTRAYCNITR